MRIGDWKINFVPPPFGTGEWELHNVADDLGETNNLRAKYPDKYNELSKAWEEYIQENGVLWGSIPPVAAVEEDDISNPIGWMKK